MSLYLRTELSKINSSFDVYYQPVNEGDNTWKSISEAIERELEAQYLANDESILGISFSIEITDHLPDDIDMDV